MDVSKPIELEINPELKSLISEGDQPSKFEPRPVQAVSQAAPPVQVNVKTFDPREPPTQIKTQTPPPPARVPTKYLRFFQFLIS